SFSFPYKQTRAGKLCISKRKMARFLHRRTRLMSGNGRRILLLGLHGSIRDTVLLELCSTVKAFLWSLLRGNDYRSSVPGARSGPARARGDRGPDDYGAWHNK